jgi:hypothetical protein
MHTISARKPEGFKVEVFDWNGKVAYSAWHQDRNEAQELASHWERLVTLNLVDGDPVLSLDEIMMSDDELLAELRA